MVEAILVAVTLPAVFGRGIGVVVELGAVEAGVVGDGVAEIGAEAGAGAGEMVGAEAGAKVGVGVDLAWV